MLYIYIYIYDTDRQTETETYREGKRERKRDTITLFSLDWPQTRDPPASASGVLGLHVCATILNYIYLLMHISWSDYRPVCHLAWCSCQPGSK
jgi:hypothetical protein